MPRILLLTSPIRLPGRAHLPFSMTLASSWPALLALLVGVALRGLLLDRPGLHPDEALYASWALRIADGSDPALLGIYVDKPPLLIYLLAALFRLTGFDGQALPDTQQLILAGRLAALLASSISLVLLGLVARRAYGPRIGLGALALFAVSPLAVRLSPTLFTDPWLVLWVLLGLWAALGQRAWLAGMACGLAYATKQQALLFMPLLVAVLLLNRRWPLAPAPFHAVSSRRLVWRWLNGFALVAVAVLWWDSLRWQWMPSYWDRSAQVYGGLALALDADLPQRLAQWGELLGYGLGWPLWLALGALVAWAVLHQQDSGAPALRSPRWFDGLVLVFSAGYLLLHVGTNLAPWDRYLLPLLPLLSLLLVRCAFWAWDAVTVSVQSCGHTSWAARTATAAALALGVLYAGYTASFARTPLGDGGAYDGVQQIAAHVRSAEPPGAILYHHWLGWHYGFYLYAAPVELRWWQEPVDLARKVAASSGQRQLIAFPAGRSQENARSALAGVGLALSPVLAAHDAYGAPSVTLYHIEPTGAGASRHVP
jgi:4-amino-4-deoxy-L-arabinose transferase-like glycosyltransferase